jgi:hypothetical protein
MTCTNKALKGLGTLRGVFGAEIDQVDGKVTVMHTDEINRKEITEKLLSLGYPEVDDEQEADFYKPSYRDCNL